MTRNVLLLVIMFVPAVAQAQSTWDIAGTAGLFAGYIPRAEGFTGYQEQWFETAQAGIVLGRYLTPHLKFEVDATVTNNGKQFRERSVSVPGYPYPYFAGSEVTTSARSIRGALTWQFRENEWVHPFVQAGVSGDFDRVSVRTWEQVFFSGRWPETEPLRLEEERTDGPTTVRRLSGMLGGGAKVYLTERAFIRTDGRWSFSRSRHSIAFRIGAGIDF